MSRVPPPDDSLDRDAFYEDEWGDDDDADYELEPVDPEILENERRMAKAEVLRAETSLDIDQVYAESEQSHDFENFFQNFKFQFQTKHLLLATAGLAIFLSLGQMLASNVAAVFVVVTALLAGAHLLLAHRDKKRHERLSEKRDRLVALARKKSAATDDELLEEAELEEIYGAEEDKEFESARTRPKLRIAFSMKEVMIAITVAAVLLGLLQLFPAGVIGAILGLIAVGGLAAYAVGFEAPPAMVLGWWVILLLYIAVSFIAPTLSSS